MTGPAEQAALAAGPRHRTAAGAPAALAVVALAVVALAAGAVVWAALPVGQGHAGTRPVLAAAVVSTVLTVAQLVAALYAARTEVMPRPDLAVYRSPLSESVRRAAGTALGLPWPEALVVTALVLEALHPARPWHTAVLGAVLLVFLFALHLAGTGDGPEVLRPHAPLLAAGLGLAALSAGAALLPTAGTGWLAAIAAIAALLAAGLALPL